MKVSACSAALIIASVSYASAFAPISARVRVIAAVPTSSSQTYHVNHAFQKTPSSADRTSSSITAKTSSNEEGIFNSLTLNPKYALPWAVFVTIATYMSINEPSGASQVLIEGFMADPLNPGFGSSLFETVFNVIGLLGLPLACVIMPGAKDQKVNPTPFLMASSLAGYGSLGLFMSTYQSPPSGISTKSDLGWFTKNVLENKIFNWLLFAVLANAYVISGAAESLVTNAGATFQEFQTMISGSALGTATTVDTTILTLVGASLVPADLERRGCFAEEGEKGKAYAIAASTILVPGVGLALYSALRPSLEED